MKNPQIPFPVTSYRGPDYFCDRDSELNTLLNNAEGGISTTLISLRRIGKTGLIKHLQHHLSDDWTSIYIDIMSTENLTEFLETLSTSVIRAIPQKTKFGKRVWDFLKSIRLNVSYDALTGEPNLGLNITPEESKIHLKNLLDLLENHNKKVLIAIDEFQQITNYPEQRTDAFLRSIYQHLTNVVFIFSGSQQHLMLDLFSNPANPFYRSTDFLHLQKIDKTIYAEFIVKMFESKGKTIDISVVKEMIEWTQSYTYYVQLLCNRTFTNSGKRITSKNWQSEAHKLLKEHDLLYYSFRDILTKSQWKLLKAIANNREKLSITNKDFIAEFKLGSSASVLRSLDALTKKELVIKEINSEGKKRYYIYDLLLMRWLQSQ